MKTDENLISTLIVLFLLAVSLLLACRFAGGPTEGWKLPIADAAAVLRESADTLDRADTDGDGFISDVEWASLALAAAVEMQNRAAQADAEPSGR